MTTIAYRDGVLASDSRSTIDNHIVNNRVQKVFKLHDGSLFAHTGRATDAVKMREYLEDLEGKRDEPRWREGWSIIIDPKGKVWKYEGDGVWLPQPSRFGAWGSGEQFALGALAMGADAQTAVKVAKEFDNMSGGAVRAVSLG